MTKLGYRPELDGVRGIAILLVLSGHVLTWPNAALGVELFFVLSGFLITTLLLREQAATGSIRLRRFYMRRALRLLPALGVLLSCLIALSLAGVARAPELGEAARGAVIGALYLANIAAAWSELPAGLQHLWSLAMEEQFYLVWPPLLLIVLARGVRPQRLAAGLAAFALLVIVNVPVRRSPARRSSG